VRNARRGGRAAAQLRVVSPLAHLPPIVVAAGAAAIGTAALRLTRGFCAGLPDTTQATTSALTTGHRSRGSP